jgi:predicted RNA-binding protein with PIN domain
MLLLVDGYNATMRDPVLSQRPKEFQRDALCAHLGTHARTLSRGASVIVIFDARGSLAPASERRGSVQVVYAPSADDEIVRRAGHAKGTVVVYTDDMRLRARISQDVGRHVEYRDVASLFAKAKKSAKGAGPHVVREEAPADARAITAELEELWLDEEE